MSRYWILLTVTLLFHEIATVLPVDGATALVRLNQVGDIVYEVICDRVSLAPTNTGDSADALRHHGVVLLRGGKI